MATPFNVPNEFVQGFIESRQSLWGALLPTPATQLPALGMPATPGETAGPAPAKPLAELQLNYFQQQFALWMRMMVQGTGAAAGPVVTPERGDRRFNAAEWRDNPAYSLLEQSYLLNARLMSDLVEAAALDEPTKHKLRFYTRQFIDSMSPCHPQKFTT